MKYGEVKKSVAGLLRGDNSKAEDLLTDKTYLSMAIRDVCMRCIPLTLLERWDESKTDVFRRVHSELDIKDEVYNHYYIRKAIIGVADDDIVEIEEELIQAVIFFMCSYLSNKRNRDYVHLAEDVISLFNSNAVDLKQYEQQ